MTVKKVLNQSRNQVEEAQLKDCPRCKGVGARHPDADNGVTCYICNGYGSCWVSGSGWTLAMYSRKAESSKLY